MLFVLRSFLVSLTPTLFVCVPNDCRSVKINRLTGTLPTELLRLTAVQHLLLYLNNWTGPVPPNLGGSSVTFDW